MGTNKLIEKYSDSLPLKLLIQNIPHIGTSLDTILSETGNKWREKRLQTLIQTIDEKIRILEISDQGIITQMEQKVNSEEFYDLFIQTCQKSSMTHSKEKIIGFANILKNYLFKEISEDYLIEVFLDITDNLSDIEISSLSKLYQSEQLEIYYAHYTDKPFDIQKMKKDISEGKLDINTQSIPDEYYFYNYFSYCYNRLEKLDLINIETGKNFGDISVSWSTQFQSSQSKLQYKRKDTVTISDLGRMYIDWVLN